MNFQKMPAKKDFCSQLLSQSSVDYPPPIWSLSSTNLITGFHWIPLDLSDFFSYFSSYLQQMAVFRTPISCIAMYLAQVSPCTFPCEWIQQVWCFPDSVLCLYYAAMPSVQLFDHLPFDHLDFLRNITAGAFWMLSILKIMRGENLQFTDWDSFTLFRPLSGRKPLFGGVPGGSRWVSLVRICPRDHFPCRKKFTR